MKIMPPHFTKLWLFAIIAGWCFTTPAADSDATPRERSFDSDWRFLRADAPGAEAAGFDASSFRLPLHKTYQGRAFAILRPAGDAGKITLKAEADGLKAAMIEVRTK